MTIQKTKKEELIEKVSSLMADIYQSYGEQVLSRFYECARATEKRKEPKYAEEYYRSMVVLDTTLKYLRECLAMCMAGIKTTMGETIELELEAQLAAVRSIKAIEDRVRGETESTMSDLRGEMVKEQLDRLGISSLDTSLPVLSNAEKEAN